MYEPKWIPLPFPFARSRIHGVVGRSHRPLRRQKPTESHSKGVWFWNPSYQDHPPGWAIWDLQVIPGSGWFRYSSRLEPTCQLDFEIPISSNPAISPPDPCYKCPWCIYKCHQVSIVTICPFQVRCKDCIVPLQANF